MPSNISYFIKRITELLCTLYYLFSITFRLAFRWHIKYESQFATILFIDYLVDFFFIFLKILPTLEIYYKKYNKQRIKPEKEVSVRRYIEMARIAEENMLEGCEEPTNIGNPEIKMLSQSTKNPTEAMLTDLVAFDKEYEGYDRTLDEKRKIHSQNTSRHNLFDINNGNNGNNKLLKNPSGSSGGGIMEQEAMKKPKGLSKVIKQGSFTMAENMGTGNMGSLGSSPNIINLASTRTLMSQRFDPGHTKVVDKYKALKDHIHVGIEVLSIFPFEIIGCLVGLHRYYTLLRLFRLIRLGWLLQYWITGSSAKRVLFLTLFMFVLAHCGACIFYSIGMHEIDRHIAGYGNWMQLDGIVEVGPNGEKLFTKGIYYIYVRALYWSVVTSVCI